MLLLELLCAYRRIAILGEVDEDPKKKRPDLAKELGIAPLTLCSSGLWHEREAGKTATHVKLKDVLLMWFRQATADGVNVDRKVLREKVENVALSLSIDDFQASGGWLHRFKGWHGLVY